MSTATACTRQYEDILLTDDLRLYLTSQYRNAGLSETEMQKILGHPDRLHKIAVDIADHYDTLCATRLKYLRSRNVPMLFPVFLSILSVSLLYKTKSNLFAQVKTNGVNFSLIRTALFTVFKKNEKAIK